MSNEPEWRSTLNAAISKNMEQNKDSISYAFADVDTDGAPRVRFVVHRGFVNERRKEEDPSHNDADKNFTSNVMLTTTDSRGPKAQQITYHKEQGCEYEIGWWLEPTGEQFRIKGRAFLLSAPNAPSNAYFPRQRLAPPLASSGPQAEFDWEAERRRIYDKLSPPLKASFLRPVPGTPLSEYDGKIEDLPQKLDKESDPKLHEDALKHFSIIAMEPSVVDYCKLKVEPNERYAWKLQGSEWKKTELAP